MPLLGLCQEWALLCIKVTHSSLHFRFHEVQITFQKMHLTCQRLFTLKQQWTLLSVSENKTKGEFYTVQCSLVLCTKESVWVPRSL